MGKSSRPCGYKGLMAGAVENLARTEIVPLPDLFVSANDVIPYFLRATNYKGRQSGIMAKLDVLSINDGVPRRGHYHPPVREAAPLAIVRRVARPETPLGEDHAYLIKVRLVIRLIGTVLITPSPSCCQSQSPTFHELAPRHRFSRPHHVMRAPASWGLHQSGHHSQCVSHLVGLHQQ